MLSLGLHFLPLMPAPPSQKSVGLVQIQIGCPISIDTDVSQAPAKSLLLAVTPTMLNQLSLQERTLIGNVGLDNRATPIHFALLKKGAYFIENATTDRNQPSSSRQLRDTTKKPSEK